MELSRDLQSKAKASLTLLLPPPPQPKPPQQLQWPNIQSQYCTEHGLHLLPVTETDYFTLTMGHDKMIIMAAWYMQRACDSQSVYNAEDKAVAIHSSQRLGFQADLVPTSFY